MDPNQQQGQAPVQNKDYGDKALDFLGKKTGHPLSEKTNESVGDGVRGMFEKVTGKKVSSKISN